MAPTPTALRLSDIDPDRLAHDVGEVLANHVGRLAFKLSPGYMIRVDGPHGFTDIGATVADLARYATGQGGLDSEVEDYCVGLVPILGSPLDPSEGPLPESLSRWLNGEVDTRKLSADSLVDQIGLVITAALGRQAIEARKPLTAPQLAALGDVSPDSVRRLVRAGEIKAEDHSAIPAKEARRWLAARDAAGFGRR